MKTINKFLLTAVLLVTNIIFAQPPGAGGPPGGPGTGTPGTTGPGARAIPLDMYVYVLAIVAIAAIFYFGRKRNAQIQ